MFLFANDVELYFNQWIITRFTYWIIYYRSRIITCPSIKLRTKLFQNNASQALADPEIIIILNFDCNIEMSWQFFLQFISWDVLRTYLSNYYFFHTKPNNLKWSSLRIQRHLTFVWRQVADSRVMGQTLAFT